FFFQAEYGIRADLVAGVQTVCSSDLFGIEGWTRFRSWPLQSVSRGSVALKQTGHFVLRDDAEQDYLIFDAGKVCPDYLPAHAHEIGRASCRVREWQAEVRWQLVTGAE